MIEGFVGTELEKKIEYGRISFDCILNGSTNDKYIIMAKEPITFDGDPVGKDLTSYNLFDLSDLSSFNSQAKFIKLKNGKNDIYFKYDDSAKNDVICYKVITNENSTESVVFNSEPKFSYWEEK